MSMVALEKLLVQRLREELHKREELLEGELTPERAGQVMGELVDMAATLAREGFQTWLEERDCRDETVQRRGVCHRFKMVSQKEFLTAAGPVVVSRKLYQADAGGPVHVPLDEAWGMEGQYAMPAVRKAVLYAVALITPGEAAELFRQCSLFRPCETTIKRLTEQMGEWLEAHAEPLLADLQEAETVPAEAAVLCASLDGVNVRLREPGPRAGRPPAGAEDVPEPTCFKNAMVGSVSLYAAVSGGDEGTEPERLQSRYVARMPEEGSPTLRAQFEKEVAQTLAHGPPEVKRLLLLDGARALWNYAEHTPLFDGFEKLIDFHHTADHLTDAGEALFGKGSKAAKTWCHKYRQILLNHDDGGKRVVRFLDRYRRSHRLRPSVRKEVVKQREFFVNNHHRMTYASFRARGWPIGSGPVEAACKTLVKMRLGRSGMRWTRPGGQHVLTLRTLVKSQRWEAFWNYYKHTTQAA